MNRYVVYTDLDGSLLDHDDYSHAAADPLLQELERTGVPVVPCTSKTRAEIIPLRTELHNRHPFIFENGAAIAIPHDYFGRKPEEARSKGDFWIRAFTLPREHWLSLIRNAAPDFEDEFTGFSDMSDADIVNLTGLSPQQARLARTREYGEPIHWRGSPERLQVFIERLRRAGAVVLRGGRFIHVSGRCDKGQALTWLNQQYAQQDDGRTPLSIAAGDSENDIAMLEAAELALVIRSPAHPAPQLKRTKNVYHSSAFGPDGWVEGIRHFITTS